MRNPLKRLIRGGAALAALLVVMVVAAPPSFAAPTLEVSQLTGLKDGQTVTITGTGFKPNLASIALGQCVVGYKGPSDCNTAGGATFRNADASGSVGTFTIVVKEKFGANDCTKTQCVIAAGPLPTTEDAATVSANSVEYKMSFGAAEEEAPATTEPAPSETAAVAPQTGGETLPQTGAGDSGPVLLLGATALLAVGGGLVLLVPGRRREAVR